MAGWKSIVVVISLQTAAAAAAAVIGLQTAAAAGLQTARYAEIIADEVVAYETPDPTSVAARLLFRGEIVVVRARVQGSGREWVSIALGGERVAYVPAAAINATTLAAPSTVWQPERAVRDDRPVGIAALGYGVSQGAGAQLRYLPMTRLGLSFAFGTIIGRDGLEGTTLAFGLQGFFGLGPLSPVIEVGGAILMSEARRSRQRIQSLYVNAGVEWMSDAGVFVAALASYQRSLRIEILFPHDDAAFTRESYGELDATGRSSVQRLSPGLLLGYAF